MSKPEKYKLQVSLTLSDETGKLLERVAKEREMSLPALTRELVILGLQSLKYGKEPGASPLQGIDPSHDSRYGA